MNITQLNSPNNYSRSGHTPDMAVVHKTLGNAAGDISHMMSSASEVSAHFHIAKTGNITQLVSIERGAWHAGRIHNPNEQARRVLKKHSWGQYVNPNKYSIGIENEALLNDVWTEPQMESLVDLFVELGKDNNQFGMSTGLLLDRLHILDHQDITSYKPQLDSWIVEALARIQARMLAQEGGESITIRNTGTLQIAIAHDTAVITQV